MGKKKKEKPLTKFPKRMQKKLIVMFICITLFLGILIGRLMYIEYTSGEKYEKIVLSQQEYDSQTIPYQRGDIVDTKGTVLATSVAVYNVILDCSVMTSKELLGFCDGMKKSLNESKIKPQLAVKAETKTNDYSDFKI